MSASTTAKLVLAGNSIGRAVDIPQRSLAMLASADLLLFEEPRGARQALKAAGIHRDFLKYSEHGESDTLEQVKSAFINKQTVLYMSDQGMPVIADPGHGLLEIAWSMGVTVEVIPGPSSLTAALSACPFYQGSFFYQGFLPRDAAERANALKQFSDFAHPVVILETPYRREALCQAVNQSFEPARLAFLALDITGPDERYIQSTCKQLPSASQKIAGKPNFVLILQGSRSPDVQ